MSSAFWDALNRSSLLILRKTGDLYPCCVTRLAAGSKYIIVSVADLSRYNQALILAMSTNITDSSTRNFVQDGEPTSLVLDKGVLRAEVQQLADHAASLKVSFQSIEWRLRKTQRLKDISPTLVEAINELINGWVEIKKVARNDCHSLFTNQHPPSHRISWRRYGIPEILQGRRPKSQKVYFLFGQCT